MRQKNWARMALVFLVVSASMSGCVTSRPVKTGKMGLFDRMDALPRAQSEPREKKSSKFDEPKYEVSAARLKEMRGVTLRWPLKKVAITSYFGARNGDVHEGIDLKASKGTPVYAAHSGTVLYSGSKISGYGRLVILRHPSGLQTVYAHHSRNMVRTGDRIKIGQILAYSGASGHATGPHLHFEIRDQSVPVDPLAVMPKERASTVVAARAPSHRARRLASSRTR